MSAFGHKSLSRLRHFLPDRLPAASARRAPAPIEHRRSFRAEALEARCLLSVVTWTGANHNGLWTDPLNWTGGTGVPTAADNVSIGSGFITVSIPSGTQSINSLTCASPLQINGGSLVLAAASTVSTLTFSSGTLDGAGNVTVSGTLNWSGGTMQGTGKTVSAAGGTLNIDNANDTLSRTLESDGAASWTSGNLSMSGGTFNNNGSFIYNSDSQGWCLGPSGTDAFNNAGSFTKLGGGEVDFYLSFNNTITGTVSVLAGTFATRSLGSSSGNMSATAPGTLLFGGTYFYNSGATITGAGTFTFIGGVWNFAAGEFNPTGTVNFMTGAVDVYGAFTPGALGPIGALAKFHDALNYTGAVNVTSAGEVYFAVAESFSALTLSGSLSGPGNVTVTGALTWSGGTMDGTGKTISAATGTLSMGSNTHYLERVLETDGTTTWTAGALQMFGGTFNNNGAFTANSFGPYQSSATGKVNAFNNAGTFTKLGAGELDFTSGSAQVLFNNTATGTVSVQAGTLALFAGGSSSGKMTVTAPGTLLFANGYTYNAGSTLSGSGTLVFQGGTHTFAAGQFNPTGAVNFAGGTITVNNAFSPTALGTIGATVTFNNAVNYSGAVNITGSAAFSTSESFSSLTLSGTLSVQAGVMAILATTNQSGGTLTGGTWNVFSNCKISLPASISTLTAKVLLYGVGSTITDSGGVTNALAGLVAISSGGSLSLQGGQSLSVTPAGGTFTNHGSINLGAGSHLSVAGAFAQGADGTFITQLSGPTSASFGEVVATGAVTLGGTLQATLGTGYNPAAGQTFSVVTGSSRTGSFSGFSGGTTSGGLPLLLNYSATSAIISINPIPLSYVGTQIDDGNRQRSVVRSLTFSFSSPVTLSAGAITLARLNIAGSNSGTNDGAPPTDASAALGTPTTSDGGLTWVVPFLKSIAGITDGSGSLLDGVYTATVHASLVTDAFNQHLATGDQTSTFHRLFGDVNGDRKVSGADFTTFSNTFGLVSGQAGYNRYFDFPGLGGKISGADFTQFSNRFGKSFIYTA